MPIVIQLIVTTFIASLGRVGMKLLTPDFIDKMLCEIIVWAAEKSAAMNPNETVTDALARDLRKKLLSDV